MATVKVLKSRLNLVDRVLMNLITDLKKELEELDMFSSLLLPVWKELLMRNSPSRYTDTETSLSCTFKLQNYKKANSCYV